MTESFDGVRARAATGVMLNIDKGMNIPLTPFVCEEEEWTDQVEVRTAVDAVVDECSEEPGDAAVEEDMDEDDENIMDEEEDEDEDDDEDDDEEEREAEEASSGGLGALAPLCLREPSKAKKLTTGACKRSRDIAEQRISVEQSFGRLKNSFKLLQYPIHIQMCKHLKYYIFSAAYLCNTYYIGFNHNTCKDDNSFTFE
jgi:hypothetical protein